MQLTPPADATPIATQTLLWAAPFLGVLVSIAVLPAAAPRFWHRRMAWVAAFWAAALLIPEVVIGGWNAAVREAVHAVLIEYLPFVTLLLALYSAGGGILVRGALSGTPAGNTALLAVGTVLAGVMGTTGAAMVLIHPLLRANAHRRSKVHLAVFFIVLVANAGGALSPLGDPPLYLGYLHGVPFFWPVRHLGPPLAVLACLLLATFYVLDRLLARHDPLPAPIERRHFRGWHNVALILVVLAAVLLQGAVPGEIPIDGEHLPLARLVASVVFLAVAAASTLTTPRAVRQANDFSWHPMAEVALLFVTIFITIGPVLRMLGAGSSGPFAPLLALLRDQQGNALPAPFFWLTGTLSAFLDNAPTYLVFFGLAGVRPETLSHTRDLVLEALSGGAVFFGALTYIGNAPNMMIRAIASHRGVHMPGFFGFTLIAASLLLPVFLILTALFFH